MQFVSARRLPIAAPAMPRGWLVSAALSFLLVLCLANSTVAANWVPGTSVLTEVALAGAFSMGFLALARVIPWPLALLAGLVASPFAAYAFAAPALTGAHPGDPRSLALINTWAGRIASGQAAADVSFYLLLLCFLFWIVGGWLAWCVLRWAQPLVGVVPGAAAFATNILNYPADQNGYTLAFLVLTIGLLLWTNYQHSSEVALRARVKLSNDARWDFWETGVVVMAAVVVLGIFLPPLSRVDSTVDLESGAFRGWADLNQRLNHPVAFGHGVSAGTSIGFADDVPLLGPIQKTGGLVFTYQTDTSYQGPRYFRGLDLLTTRAGEWRYDSNSVLRAPLARDTSPPYAEDYEALGAATFKVQMLKPPAKAPDALFFPGQFLGRVDRETSITSDLGSGAAAAAIVSSPKIYSVDRVSGTHGGSAGPYRVTVLYSQATDTQLRSAGTDYPAWVYPYTNFGGAYRVPGSTAAPLTGGAAYRPPATLQRIRQLALQVTAASTNPYDQATAIETYLRSSYSYTLTPPPPPADGTDPLDYFLFTSKEGYCEYFATAMGDLLRSLGIPTRLVNGYGPGTYDARIQRFVVRESDAHTWVEAYFPGYGWVPFEPTADGTYFPIQRGSEGSANCTLGSEICTSGDPGVDSGSAATVPPDRAGLEGDVGGGSATSGGLLNVPPQVPAGGAVLLLLAAIAFVAVSRYLRPATVAGVWARTLLLVRAAGLPGPAGETPHEFGTRVADEFPETGSHIRLLAGDFAIAAYAPPRLAAGRRTSVLATWESLRPLLVHRVLHRFHLAR